MYNWEPPTSSALSLVTFTNDPQQLHQQQQPLSQQLQPQQLQSQPQQIQQPQQYQQPQLQPHIYQQSPVATTSTASLHQSQQIPGYLPPLLSTPLSSSSSSLYGGVAGASQFTPSYVAGPPLVSNTPPPQQPLSPSPNQFNTYTQSPVVPVATTPQIHFGESANAFVTGPISQQPGDRCPLPMCTPSSIKTAYDRKRHFGTGKHQKAVRELDDAQRADYLTWIRVNGFDQ
ncbi:hypothetical protein V1514DRAFT_337222 [Lipomyces japonicus]|uniref:uncharacterized protein n=1 Tax=Lipomyces japonicus TaxID=56871 RepID=UPI0034CD321E